MCFCQLQKELIFPKSVPFSQCGLRELGLMFETFLFRNPQPAIRTTGVETFFNNHSLSSPQPATRNCWLRISKRMCIFVKKKLTTLLPLYRYLVLFRLFPFLLIFSLYFLFYSFELVLWSWRLTYPVILHIPHLDLVFTT